MYTYTYTHIYRYVCRPAEDEAIRVARSRFERGRLGARARQLRGKVRFMTRFQRRTTDLFLADEIPPIMAVNERSTGRSNHLPASPTLPRNSQFQERIELPPDFYPPSPPTTLVRLISATIYQALITSASPLSVNVVDPTIQRGRWTRNHAFDDRPRLWTRVAKR